MRWKNFGEMSTDDGHTVYISGDGDRHEYGVGVLVHKDIASVVLGCLSLLRAAPCNITFIQVYASTSGHDDSEVDHNTIYQTSKKDILVVQEDWKA